MLLNLTNHPSATWPDSQRQAAVRQFGEVQDLPFPAIDPNWPKGRLQQLAEEYAAKVKKLNPKAVHIAGEPTFNFMMVNKLKDMGYPCLAATTERNTTYDKDGRKISAFKFVTFREY